MADNIDTEVGKIATDQCTIGGESVHVPRNKMGFGTDGNYQEVDASHGLPVADTATPALLGAVNETAPASDTASSGLNGRLQRIAQRLSSLITLLTNNGTNLLGKVAIDQTTDGTTNKVNIDASLKSGTATRTAVNSGTSSVAILAANANRKGATIYNNDANALLLDLSGGTASATRCQVRLETGQSHEVGSGYTGAITGIWESDGSGAADVVEFV